MEFYLIDAFADAPYGGNLAGVVLLGADDPWPEPAFMRSFAAELRASETAFIMPLGGGLYRLRFFTPVCEVDLCGHATLAGFAALRMAGLNTPAPVARTNAGDVAIAYDGSVVWMEMAESVIDARPDDALIRATYDALGLREPDGCKACVVKTGLADLMTPVADRDALMAARPDQARLRDLSERMGVVGFHLFALNDAGAPRAYCRNLAPLVGIPEEAATGTSSASLACYLAAQGLMPHGEVCAFVQGEAMGRPSRIYARVADSAPVRARIGGEAAALAHGVVAPGALYPPQGGRESRERSSLAGV